MQDLQSIFAFIISGVRSLVSAMNQNIITQIVLYMFVFGAIFEVFSIIWKGRKKND